MFSLLNDLSARLWRTVIGLVAWLCVGLIPWMPAVAQSPRALEGVPSYLASPKTKAPEAVDTALIISVDVSQSVDDHRYQLQMEGVAQALEDPDVIATITSSPSGKMLFSMIAWADKTRVVLPWTWIGSAEDAHAVADVVRHLPPQSGEFTCMGRMFRVVGESILSSMPRPARKVLLDVSSDGIDNCNQITDVVAARDQLLERGVTINGNPILVAGENDVVGAGAYRAPGYGLVTQLGPDTHMTTLPEWYQKNVVGGRGAFMLPAIGYGDFSRAIKRKFVMEISGLSPTGRP